MIRVRLPAKASLGVIRIMTMGIEGLCGLVEACAEEQLDSRTNLLPRLQVLSLMATGNYQTCPYIVQFCYIDT